MKKYLLYTLLLISSVLSAGIPMHSNYRGPTKCEIKREGMKRISEKIKKLKVPLELIPFFNKIAENEDWGHIGYHGANQGYRIYQDIIRITLEEIVNIPIRDDFHFLRVPGDKDLNVQTFKEFLYYWGEHIDNKNDVRAKQLLSLNFGIYSNFDSTGSSSIGLFVKDKSRTKIDYAKNLKPFFNKLGINHKYLHGLFLIGKKWLDEEGGILLQISENSHLSDLNQEAYNFADEHCYPAKRGGHLYGKSPISYHYQHVMTKSYISKRSDIAPQLRLLLDNKYTLNPYSHLVVRRWDLYDKKTVAAYEKELREYIRNMTHDPIKAALYRDALLYIWCMPEQ